MPFPLPNDPAAALHNGTEFFRAGCYPGAVAQLAHCLTLEPDNVRARYVLALAYFRMDNEFRALPEYNRLAAMRDVEAQLATAMLRRAFLLRDGDPLADVTALTPDEAADVVSIMTDPCLQPTRFASMFWEDKWGGDHHEQVDLSIVFGPRQRFYCTLPPEQAPLGIDEDSDWVPAWSCSARVFDRIAAMQLFFQRALLYWRYGYHFCDPPLITRAGKFTPTIRDMLIRRIYGDADVAEAREQPSLFPHLPRMDDDFGD